MNSQKVLSRRRAALLLFVLIGVVGGGTAFFLLRSQPAPPAIVLPPTSLGEAAVGHVTAFPGAEGVGALAVGGRGGRILEVTNLNDNGAGSLRAAIEARGPRIVVFRVGGVIEIEKPLRINEPYITIAGQTAPGGGITIRGHENSEGEMIIISEVHDVVIRYLRIRHGGYGEPGKGQSNIAIDSGAYNIIIDHCSFSWSLDENVMIHRNIPEDADPATWPEIYNVTLQRSLIAEGLAPHSTGTQIGGESEVEGWRGVYDLTIHHNLYANNSHRNPGVGSLQTQIINNVVYNWSPRVGSTWRDIDVDWIGNYFKSGPMSNEETILVHNAFPKTRPDQWWPAPSLYITGNMAPPAFADPTHDNWPMYAVHYAGTALPEEYRRHEPLPSPPIPVTLQSAAEAYESVLADVGANGRLDCLGNWLPNADAVDLRLLDDVRNGTGPDEEPPSHEDEVGGFPTLEPGAPCDDSDHDGMPDAWEVATGMLDPTFDDSAGHDLHEQYTNVEMYLNGLQSFSNPS